MNQTASKLPTDWLTFPPARRFYALASKEVGQCFGMWWYTCDGLQWKFRRVKVRLLILTTILSRSQSWNFPRWEFRPFRKKLKKRKFCCGSPLLWFVIFKTKTNICHYFPSMDLPPNIWSIQLVPFYNPCIWKKRKWLVLLLYTVKSYQILNKKWNWKYLILKYFLSETIHAQEKWDQRCSFCKILKFQFP